MAKPGATPSHQLFAGFNAFFSPTWKKTRVEQVSLKVFHLWCILGHPTFALGPAYFYKQGNQRLAYKLCSKYLA